MRSDTIFKFKFAFEYWTLQGNADGTSSYAFAEDRVGMLLPGGAMGGHMVCAEPMNVPTQIRNVRDASGTPIFVANDNEPYPMFVTSSEPQLDPFSNIVGYSHQLRRQLPREYSQFIQEVLERE